ncbi:hypothetical protein CB473P2_00115 [Enterocloster phage CB473P2]|nr:hypothetical protein CB457P2_00115 [Enterocloster phage CB457P2]WAX11402.1 hypothetical protein CB473P1_00115 [Enterocloster phage CB473P1]WAX11535.1 hypothetical protein CB473P2_00115 [Enterocloster phage CB473P2]
MTITNKKTTTLFWEYYITNQKAKIMQDDMDMMDDKSMFTIGKAQGLRDSIRYLGLTDNYKQWLYANNYYTIQAEDIRRFCINKSLYTMGTNDEYIRLLDGIDNQCITLRDIAKDIYDHSQYLDGMTAKDLEKEIITTIIRRI